MTGLSVEAISPAECGSSSIHRAASPDDSPAFVARAARGAWIQGGSRFCDEGIPVRYVEEQKRFSTQ
jgi:hypothetical protein